MVVTSTNAVVELNNANIVGEHLQLNSGNAVFAGLFDQPSSTQIASSNNNNASLVRMGSGSLRAVAGNSSWTGDVQLRNSSNANTNTYGITVNQDATLDLSGVLSAVTNSGTTATGHALFKQGAGLLSLSGTAGNTASGTTFVNEGTLQLNKQGATWQSTARW